MGATFRSRHGRTLVLRARWHGLQDHRARRAAGGIFALRSWKCRARVGDALTKFVRKDDEAAFARVSKNMQVQALDAADREAWSALTKESVRRLSQSAFPRALVETGGVARGPTTLNEPRGVDDAGDGSLPSMDLCTGRVVIVTGAARGIGREHALEFARHGARVIVNDLGTSVAGAGRSNEAGGGGRADHRRHGWRSRRER